MKAFNAVANANPYVLLATAILGVIGAIVSYTAATEDATAADEAATKAADERKESMENYASSFGNNAGEMLVKYEALRNEWNALGNDINAKRKYLVQHKSDFVAVANAAGMDASSVRDVGSAEKNLIHNTGAVEAAIMRRAKAMAAYAEYVRLTQLKLQELEKAGTYSYKVYKQGERVAKSDFAKAGLKMNSEQQAAAQYEGYGGGISSGTTWLSGDQAAKMTEYFRQEARKKAIADMEEISKKYDGMMDRALHRAGFNTVGEAYAASQGPIEGGGGSRGGGNHGGGSKPSGRKSTGSKSSGGKSAGAKKTGKKTTSSGKTKQEEAKDEKELQEMLLSILIDANKKKTKVVEEYSEEWRKLMKVGLMEQREQELSENKKKYKKDMEDLKKSLAQKKISQEEYEKMKYEFEQAYIERAKSIREAYGEESLNVDKEIEKHKEELAHKELETLEKKHEEELRLLNQENVEEIQKIREHHQEELMENRNNLDELEQLKKEQTFELERIELMHAEKVAQKTIETLEKQLKLENLTAEDRQEVERKLQEAKNNLANASLATKEALLEHEVEAQKEAADKILETDQELMEKRKELFDQWSEQITEGINTVAELVGQIYDNQIAKVQELIDAEQKRYEEEVNHIEWLADRGAITTEEAEIRKRDAAERTAKVQEALEKKKKAAEYKKAIVEKANSVAQAAIATALAVTKALPNIALAAVVGALGAIQIATILAQPIKAYAEGTKGKPHPGGLAVVGDGNRAELVMYGKRAWITPDSPTLVDLPKGAEVMPDASKVDLVQMGSSLFMTLPKRKGGGGPIIVNDYEALEGRVATNTKAVTAELRAVRGTISREFRRQNFRNYINART
jgi:hypothetical protein